jgi:hypothetical protein
MTMPRLSLYRPEKGNDYRFIDKTVWEMFQVGGVDVLVHKYLGPGDTAPGAATPTTPVYDDNNPFNIQDLLFLENRDRKYDPDVYLLRGVYNMQDIDFNLSQFGLFLQNDTIFITFHINDTVEKLGRKILSGDVIELPHLKDDFALNDLSFALKRFYVVEEVNRAAEGFSVTWYPHLYRAKCKPLVDSQEYKDILDGIADTENSKGTWSETATYYPGDVVTGSDGVSYTCIQEVTGIEPPNAAYWEVADSLRDIMSTYNTEMSITQAVLNQAESDAPRSGYDTTHFYTVQQDADGRAELVTVDNNMSNSVSVDSETQATDADSILLYDQSTWSSTYSYKIGDVFAFSNIMAGMFVQGRTYEILSLGNTDWNIVAGTSTNPITYKIGDRFVARNIGTGTGTAHDIYNASATKYTVIATRTTDLRVNPTPPNTTYYEDIGLADAQYVGSTAATMLATAKAKGYTGYITEDGIPANGAPFTAGIAFPQGPVEGQYCLRKDYMPNRLFRFNGARWVKIEDVKRMTMSNLGGSDTGAGDQFQGKDVRLTQKTSFINNDNVTCIDGREVEEKQSLSKALRPKADE